MEREPTTTVKALSQTLSAIISESQQARSSGSTEWYVCKVLNKSVVVIICFKVAPLGGGISRPGINRRSGYGFRRGRGSIKQTQAD